MRAPGRKAAAPILIIAASLAAGCSALLPKSEAITDSPWKSYAEAQAAFDRITPYSTTVEELRSLNLDPAANPNITILNYSDVLRRFVPAPSVDATQLDQGVRDCIAARTVCKGYEVDQRAIRRDRYGSFWADFLNFKRKIDVAGWRFTGMVLIRDGVVVYKLTGGQPRIHEHEETRNPLGPLQGRGDSLISIDR